jgi:adenylate kinase family enzyme
MSKLCIWIIGGSGVGKTTLAASIHSMIAELTKAALKPQIIGWGDKDKEFVFTRMSKYSSNLGTFGQTACGGTDSLSTKDRISGSYLEAIKHSPIVVIEGIMATSTWFDWIKEPDRTKLFLIHLEISPEENFRRLRIRRAARKGIKPEDVELQPKTLDNLSSKLKNFRNLYRKIAPKSDYHLQIHCEVLNQERTADIVRQFMIDHILS